jgi:hypothetical protein
MTDERLDTWYVWLDSHIRPEVYGLHLHRHVWLETQAMLRENPDLPESYWWEFMGDTYAVTQALALRRQVDTRRDVISLARLMMQMRRGARVLSRGYFLSRYGTDPNMVALGEETWADTFAGDAGEHLDPAIPSADLDTLVTAAAAVKDFVDDHLAHRSLDAQPAQTTVTLDDLHSAIDVVGLIYRKYFGLMTGAMMLRVTPVIQGDWQAVFRQPWMKP